jgi:hypothetical protein
MARAGPIPRRGHAVPLSSPARRLVFETDVDVNGHFTTIDTAGCSCEQIIGRTGAGLGHARFGRSNDPVEDRILALP